jgi:hypothetical protein
MDLIILGVLGIVVMALGYLVARVERVLEQRPIVVASRQASCHAQACQSEPCQGEPCKAAPCHAELVRPVVDLSGIERRLAQIDDALEAGVERINRLASEERVRDRDQHAELLHALRQDVQGIANREAETVLGLAAMCSELGSSADTAYDVALRQVRKERQKVLREKIARARAARAAH